MTLELVPRRVRALSSHINAYYDVLKGAAQDSIFLRLAAAGGAFEVRHSATNAPVLRVTDAGVSGVITPSDATVTNAKLAPDAVTTDKVLDGTLLNADVNAAAGIAVTKLAHVGAGNVLKSSGSANVGGQVVDADVAPSAAVGVAKLGAGGTANRVVATSDGLNTTMQQVTSAMIADGTIVDVDVNAAAAIAVTKLAHVGAGNVLKSTGSANVGGQVVDADVAAGANIDGAKLADGTITASKLGAGITAPAVALLATQTLASPAASITFAGISGSYKHLQIRIYGRATLAAVAESVYVQFNGDATASYEHQAMTGAGSAVSAAEALYGTGGAGAGLIGFVTGASAAAASWWGTMTVEIPSYSSATAFKVLTCVSYFGYGAGASNQQARIHGVTWAPGVNAAIASILLKPSGSSWQTGTVASLYGYT